MIFCVCASKAPSSAMDAESEQAIGYKMEPRKHFDVVTESYTMTKSIIMHYTNKFNVITKV